MSSVTMQEFSSAPDAILARARNGETITVTLDDEVIAVISPSRLSHYEMLVARGDIIPGKRGLTTSDLDKYTRIEVPEDVDPLAILLEMRADER
jgi:antitoxin (DNA-binding transcriptional repressor) of toxin-antitoxin stability system